jgi:hypothetical protein
MSEDQTSVRSSSVQRSAFIVQRFATVAIVPLNPDNAHQETAMDDRKIREKYGGKLPKAINRAIRAEIPGGNEALDKLTQLAGAARHSGWKDFEGNSTVEAKAYFRHKRDVIDRMDAEVRKRWGVPPAEEQKAEKAPRAARPARPPRTGRANASGPAAPRAARPEKNARTPGTAGKGRAKLGPPKERRR